MLSLYKVIFHMPDSKFFLNVRNRLEITKCHCGIPRSACQLRYLNVHQSVLTRADKNKKRINYVILVENIVGQFFEIVKKNV